MADSNRGYGVPDYLSGAMTHAPTPRWLERDIAAEVPAIQLTRNQWDTIMQIVNALAELHSETQPGGLTNALIQGSLLEVVAKEAAWLKSTLEWLNDPKA